MKENGPDAMEIKRMFVTPASRGKGVAAAVLAELEKWAAELSFSACLLETGKRQPEAIRLYTKNGYQPTPNYGQYTGIENSLCFRKEIK
jgi:putative acetyltransferase